MAKSVFDAAWNNARKNIFRLEILPIYHVSGDWQNYQNFLKGKFKLSAEDKNWLKQLKQTARKDVSIQRVRIVSEPISDYLLFELNFWKHSAKAGEKIIFLSEKKFEKLKSKLKMNPKDFWLFDNQILLVFHYSPKGKWIKSEQIKNKKTIQKFVQLKKELIKVSNRRKESF